MKRPLTKTEETLTNSGVKKREEEIVNSKESLEIHNKQKEFIKAKREYEDIVTPYNRKIEDVNLKIRIDKLSEELEIAEKDIENLRSQLKEGVEVKKMTGVS